MLCILYDVFLQTNSSRYLYIDENTRNISPDIAEQMCVDEDGYHLLSLNSHEEHQLLEEFFNELTDFHHINTIYLFISLRKEIRVCFTIL